jgi:predicted lipoprotein with Yx(FWY)xxD motif
MKRLITLGMAIPAALALAACGSSGTTTSAVKVAGSPTSPQTVFVRHLSGFGSVLVDQTGEALYSPNLEASGKILCVTACTGFWKPLTLSSGNPTASAAVGKLGLIKRPDGSMQVAVNGKPLYTFAEDSPGKVTGNGFHDQFGGHHFTWNVVHPGGITNATKPDSGTGTGSTTSSNGSYSY